MIYKLYKSQFGNILVRLKDGASIPFDEGNVDYQAYLAWVAEGNTAEEWTNE